MPFFLNWSSEKSKYILHHLEFAINLSKSHNIKKMKDQCCIVFMVVLPFLVHILVLSFVWLLSFSIMLNTTFSVSFIRPTHVLTNVTKLTLDCNIAKCKMNCYYINRQTERTAHFVIINTNLINRILWNFNN